MIKHNRYVSISFFAALLILQSCSKDYFDLNENPNLVTTPSLSSLLSTVTHKTGINNYNVGSITSNYVQYTANPSASAASDIYQQVDYTSTWDALYYTMADISDMKTQAIEQGSSEYLGVANTLLSYNLTLVTDLWGDAPFSEAFSSTNFTPKYDTQEQLHQTSLTLLDSAIVQLGRTDAVIKLAGAKDLIHGGARAKWLMTAYALKARLLNKVSKTATYNPTSVLAAVSNSYKSNADDAGMSSFFTRNPWAQVAVNNAGNTLGGWLSEQFIDHLNGTTYGIFDPRLRKISRPTVNNSYIGTVNGAGNRPPGGNTVKDENYIDSTSPWTGTASPILLVTYAEIKFIEAEAALATDPARAYTAYLTGINANMDKLQVPAGTERTAYINAVSIGAAGLTRALIFKEKYIATYLNPEAWNDARRFNYAYKDFTLPVNAELPTFIRRLAYPTGERSKNGKNIPNIGTLADRLWWDK
ncbi:MAG: SusD/RagB family nutrient-binding outer membrane lipoprotein [Pedobacter sp.]|nr:MAG: SusD/RagB family nutrient-binding outer membrane lipoprotein [Pedobacter sp.]